MARLTPTHTVTFMDPRGKHLPHLRGTKVIGAQASQVGPGVHVFCSDGFILPDRESWEKVKNAIDQAWRDNEEIPCPKPIW